METEEPSSRQRKEDITLTASSGEQAGRRNELSKHSIVFDADEFRVIFQVTQELVNFQESRLLELGVSGGDLRELITVLRKVDSRMVEASRVRLLLRKEGGGVVGFPVLVEEMTQEGALNRVVKDSISSRIAEKWHSLVQFAIKGLGAHELFFRAGYSLEEIESSVEILDFRNGRRRLSVKESVRS